jgi:4'-phosphopantetheinyl transferase
LPGYHLYCGDINLRTESRSPDRSEGVINIWTIDINSQLPVLPLLRQILSPSEIAHAARFHQEKDAQQYIVTRAVLRILLADTLAVQPQDIEIITSANKKPVLARQHEIHFNVSHSGNQAVIAIAGQAVGVDVEWLQPAFEYQSVAEYAFSDRERVQLRSSKNPYREFFSLWTRKEAFLKGLGEGLINDMQLLSCMYGRNEIPPAIGDITGDWEVKTAALGPEYTMSLAFERSPLSNQIFLFDFSHAAL